MPDIHMQLAWEQRMVNRGVERFRAQQDEAVKGGRGHETSAGARLLRAYVIQASDHIRLYLDGKHPDGRRRNKYAALLATLNTDKSALFALTITINTMYHPQTTQSICVQIGKRVEDEIRFSKFHTEHKEYYEEIARTWEDNNSTDYRFKRAGLVHLSKRKEGFDWEDWDKETHFGVGALIVGLVMEVCDLIHTVTVHRSKNRKEVFLAPTPKCIEWVSKHNGMQELLTPDTMPCIIQPQDWTSVEDGGYYSPEVRSRVPMVKTRGTAGAAQRKLLAVADMPGVYTAVNAMQRTGWRVNSRVLETMREVWHKNLNIGMPRSQPYDMPACPLPLDTKPSDYQEGHPLHTAFHTWKAEAREVHGMEKERVAQNLAVTRTIRIAADMKEHSTFYYVYTCDFRGRVYAATAGLSPQGTDHGKGLLEFSTGKPLGPTGLYWLKVHGANRYGYDKEDYAERVRWVDERHESFIRAADDPINYREVWQDADKPYQFLAFLFEYAEAHSRGEKYISHLPVGLDGSCNGLQHFSAMLRDTVGGAAVNLTPSLKPSDIYQQVGDVATRKLVGLRSMNTDQSPGAANWLALFKHLWGVERMMRKLPKKPVMTLPYGSTRQACTETVFRFIMDEAPGFLEKNTTFSHALYLTPVIWSSISEVVVAARAAMDWIQACSSVLSKAGHPIEFITPLGFPVYQASRQYETRKIETQIGGRLQLHFATDTDKLDVRFQRQGSSPNFVHSVDATHMLMCVNAGSQAGIDSFAMIHDDFGVHACDTAMWHRIIREEFVRLHSEQSVLDDFKAQHETRHDLVLPDLPPKGALNIRDVLDSPYFFG